MEHKHLQADKRRGEETAETYTSNLCHLLYALGNNKNLTNFKKDGYAKMTNYLSK